MKKNIKRKRDLIFSPVLTITLLVSFALWYITKLNHTYRTNIPIDIQIESNDFRVYCQVEGSGYRLIGHKYIFSKGLELSPTDIEMTQVNDTTYKIDPFSLQNAISSYSRDIRIVSIGYIPRITIKK